MPWRTTHRSDSGQRETRSPRPPARAGAHPPAPRAVPLPHSCSTARPQHVLASVAYPSSSLRLQSLRSSSPRRSSPQLGRAATFTPPARLHLTVRTCASRRRWPKSCSSPRCVAGHRRFAVHLHRAARGSGAVRCRCAGRRRRPPADRRVRADGLSGATSPCCARAHMGASPCASDGTSPHLPYTH